MSIDYVVVADVSRARVFTFDSKTRQLEELKGLTHPQSRLQERELDADKPGRHAGGVSGSRHSVNPRDESVRHEAEVFARELGKWLETEHQAGRFDHLVLVCPPRFLGELRSHLSARCTEALVKTVNKDLVRARPADIVDHILDPDDNV